MAVKKAFGFVRNCVEKYIPSIALAALFIIFCYQVFMRYVLRQPQAWAGEVEQSCFLWLVLLGACYAQRMKAHVTFTLLYDKLSIKGKAVDVVVPATFAAQGKTGVFEGRLTIRRGDFSIGEGAWKAFDIVANDVVIQFRLTAAAQ